VAIDRLCLGPALAGTHFFFSYDQQTGFGLPLVSALLGLAVFGTFILNNAEARL